MNGSDITNNFTIIYKILKALEQSMDYEEFDSDLISPEVLGVTKERRDKLLVEMQNEGYISGLCVKQYLRGNTIVKIQRPEITIKVLEYLSENSMMKKAANLIKGIAEIIP